MFQHNTRRYRSVGNVWSSRFSWYSSSLVTLRLHFKHNRQENSVIYWFQPGVCTSLFLSFYQPPASFKGVHLSHLLTRQINLCIGLSPVIKPHGLKNETIAALIRSSPDIIYLLFGRKSLISSTPFWISILSRQTFASIIDLCLRLLFAWNCDFMPNRHIGTCCVPI